MRYLMARFGMRGWLVAPRACWAPGGAIHESGRVSMVCHVAGIPEMARADRIERGRAAMRWFNTHFSFKFLEFC